MYRGRKCEPLVGAYSAEGYSMMESTREGSGGYSTPQTGLIAAKECRLLRQEKEKHLHIEPVVMRLLTTAGPGNDEPVITWHLSLAWRQSPASRHRRRSLSAERAA